MKVLRLILEIYKKNIISSIFLLIIFTISIIYASLSLGQYRYITYTKDLFVQSNLQNSIYYMPSGFSMQITSWSSEEYHYELNKVYDNILAYSAVDSITKSPWTIGVDIQVYDEALLNSYPIELSEGDSFSDNNSNLSNGFEAIVGGKQYKDVKVGDIIYAPLYDADNNSIPIRIIGKTSDILYLPNFGTSSTQIGSQNFLQQNKSIIILKNTPELMNYVEQYTVPSNIPNFFVNVKQNSSEQEKEELYNYLDKNGRYTTYEQILENSDLYISETAKATLPLPLCFLFISTVALITISILFVLKSFKRNCIYYLCGCNKLRSYSYLASAIGGISIVAGIISGSIIGSMNSMIGSNMLNLQEYIFDQMSIWSIIIYIIIVLIVSIGIPYLVYRRMSPIELYRRAQ